MISLALDCSGQRGWRPAAAKTLRRSWAYLRAAALMREPERDQVLVVWLFGVGAVWLAVSPGGAQGGELWVAPLLLGILVAICAIDSRYGIIPDPLVGLLVGVGLVHMLSSLLLDDCAFRLAAAVGVYLCGLGVHASYRRLRGYDGFGLGDVKLVAAACVWIGAAALSILVLVAVVSACGSLAILRLKHRISRHDMIPFGPHLAVGLWLVWSAATGGALVPPQF